MNSHPAFRVAPRWAILIPRLRRSDFSNSPSTPNSAVWDARRAGCARSRLLSAVFAGRVGRLPHSMRPSPPGQRTNVAGLWAESMHSWMRRKSRIRQYTSPAPRDGNKIAQHGAPSFGAECWVGCCMKSEPASAGDTKRVCVAPTGLIISNEPAPSVPLGSTLGYPDSAPTALGLRQFAGQATSHNV